MRLSVCNLNAYGCFELHTEPENVVNKISIIFSFQSWQVWVLLKNCVDLKMPGKFLRN